MYISRYSLVHPRLNAPKRQSRPALTHALFSRSSFLNTFIPIFPSKQAEHQEEWYLLPKNNLKKWAWERQTEDCGGANKRLGQVTVGVLLSVHSLQILFLYEDVDALLQNTEKMSKRCEETVRSVMLIPLLLLWGTSAITHFDDRDSGFEPGRELIQNFCQKLLVLQNLPHLHDSHYGRLQEDRCVISNKRTIHLLLWIKYEKTNTDKHASGGCEYLNKEFSVLLNVFVGCFLFLFLLSLHWHINVHSQLFTGKKNNQLSIITSQYEKWVHVIYSRKCIQGTHFL